MAYEMVMPYHLHMPSYFLETFTEYPCGMIQSYLFTIKTESVYPKARPFWGNFGIFTGQL